MKTRFLNRLGLNLAIIITVASLMPLAKVKAENGVGQYKPQTATTPAAAASESTDYKSCDSINDYVSYVKCIADIDSKKQTGQSSTELTGKASDYGVTINNGGSTTKDRKITIKLKAPAEATTVAISKDSNFGFSPREPFAKEKKWELDDADGATQYVYVKFYDKINRALFIASASVVYSKNASNVSEEKSNNVDSAKPEKDAQANQLNKCALKSKASAILSTDSKGADVKAVQESLKCLGYLTEDKKIDGIFDTQTEAAIKKVQEDNKLTCKDGSYCGVVGPSTRKLLISPKMMAKGKVVVTEKVKVATKTEAKVETTASTDAKKAVSKEFFKKNMQIGLNNDNAVKALQGLLATDKEIYPEGSVNGNFDDVTEEAVKRFQEKNNLKCNNGTYCGAIGPSTRAKLNAWYYDYYSKK